MSRIQAPFTCSRKHACRREPRANWNRAREQVIDTAADTADASVADEGESEIYRSRARCDRAAAGA